MLTVSVIKNTNGAAQYYSKEDNYYLSEVDAKEASMWLGEGAARLGLSGKVEERALHDLLSGRLPNGTVIGLQKDGTINHRPGYDLCFQAPKSVSILALDGGDKRLYDAHLDAVKETLKIIERDCAQSKIFKDEQISFDNTKNLAVALIAHTTSRKLDLHLHHHALVMNCTQREDGSWRALASSKIKSDQINGFSERIYNHRIYYGLIYQTSLANKVIKLGHAIETVGPHGMWEIKGVSKAAREIMSKRRKEIEKKIKDLNYRSLKAADVATLDTREKKPNNINLKEIKKIWQIELSSAGFVSKEYLASIDRQKGLGINSLLDISKAQNSFALSTNAKEAVYDAIEHLSQYRLKLDYSKIAACALEFSIGTTSHRDIIHALDEVIEKREIIPLDKSESLFATKTLIEAEKALMDLAAAGRGSVSPIALKSKEIARIEVQETKERCLKILQSKNRLHLIEHMANDNKELISGVLALAESSGKTVRVLSPNRMMTYDINENIKRKPNNLWQWLVALGKPEVGACVSGFLRKYQEEIDNSLFSRQDKDLFIVNNAETLGGNDLKSLLKLTAKTNARVIFLRDTSVRQGFGAGSPMETLKQAGIEAERMVSTTATTKRIDKITEIKAIQDDAGRTIALAKAFAAKDDTERENTLILVGAKSQIKITNEAIRDELKSLGKLTAEEYRFSVLNTAGLSKVESSLAHKYQNNMVIRFYAKGELPTDWSVDSSNRDSNTVRLRLECKNKRDIGRSSEKNTERNIERISWDPKKHTNSNYSIFKREVLSISQGDKLIAAVKMSMLGINQAERFTVTALEENHIELLSNKNKTYCINKADLKDSHFDYAYTTTLNRSSQKQAAHVVADFKAYSLDKLTLNDLNIRAKDSLTIFTNDAKTIQKRFGIVPVKLTGAETILKAATPANPERLISDKTINEIKRDIDTAITILSTKEDETNDSAAKKAVEYAIEKITSCKAGFTHKELVAEALSYALKDQIAVFGKAITHESVMNIISERRKSDELVMGKYFDDGTRWTTKEILATERSIIDRLKTGINKLESLLEKEAANKLLVDSSLTQDQKNACYLITTTKDQFVIIQGYAGTGKTTMFGQVREMLKDINNVDNPVSTNKEAKEKDLIENIESTKNIKSIKNNQTIQMLALAPTHRAVKELKNVGIEAQTLKSFILEQQKAPAVMDNKLIVLDEASMVSNKDFDKFLNLVKDTKAHVVLSGDIAQHIAIESGKPFETAQRFGILKTAYLREIVRQKNHALKEAVESVIHKDYKAAFEKIAGENPQNYIARNNQSMLAGKDKIGSFFSKLQHSIVEIDNNKLKPGEAAIEQRIAEDYLSRTQETREQTVVIVHANHDRRIIADIIRNGLKEQGEIDSNGVMANCLIAKGLTEVEYKSPGSYGLGDIVKIGREYYTVDKNDHELKSLLLKAESGKPRYFYPEKETNKYNIETYECIQSELAIGDTIRLTKTDKGRERYANFEYRVEVIANNIVTLKSKDKDNEQLMLRLDGLKDAHWDYAYTVTGYGIQGGSKPYAIDFEASYRKNLANQRSFYIGASRAAQHLIVYTDNKERLLDRILRNRGDKYSALEVVGETGQAGTNTDNKKTVFKKAANYYDFNYNQQNYLTKTQSGRIDPSLSGIHADYSKDGFSSSNFSDSFNYSRIEELISSSAEVYIERILGKPNAKLSTMTEWRYGNKGSLAINMGPDKKGLWHNFETGESGNLISLIKKETGLPFKDVLKYVTNMPIVAPYSSIKKDNLSKNIDNSYDKHNSKTKDYALTLAKESLPIHGTIVEKYLKDKRGIRSMDAADIRFHPSVYVGQGGAGKNKHLPAMIAIGRDKEGQVKCVQATYLDPKTADKADLDVKKRTYSSPAEAGVILKKDEGKDRTSYITEGVETGLSIKDAVKAGEVIAALGKSNFTTLDPAKLGSKVVFCLDNDGKNIYRDQLIFKAAERLIRAGKDVFFTIPRQINNQKTDFNDIIKKHGVTEVKNYLTNIKSYDRLDKKIEKTHENTCCNNEENAKKDIQKNRINGINAVNTEKQIKNSFGLKQKIQYTL